RELFEQLEKILKGKRSKKRTPSTHSVPPPQPFDPQDVPQEVRSVESGAARSSIKRPHYEKELIRLMLQYGREMIDYIGGLCNENLFEDSELKSFYLDIISRHQNEETVEVEHYLHREEPYPSLTGDIMLEQYTASDRHAEKTGTHFKRDRDPIRTAKSTIKPLRLHYLKRYLAELAEQTKTVDSESKKVLIRKQKRTQREISHMEQTPADRLFPDLPGQQKTGISSTVFEYKMKDQKE
ncbi:MAG: DNA primase, partial [Balneolaceae bacterium]